MINPTSAPYRRQSRFGHSRWGCCCVWGWCCVDIFGTTCIPANFGFLCSEDLSSRSRKYLVWSIPTYLSSCENEVRYERALCNKIQNSALILKLHVYFENWIRAPVNSNYIEYKKATFDLWLVETDWCHGRESVIVVGREVNEDLPVLSSSREMRRMDWIWMRWRHSQEGGAYYDVPCGSALFGKLDE